MQVSKPWSMENNVGAINGYTAVNNATEIVVSYNNFLQNNSYGNVICFQCNKKY